MKILITNDDGINAPGLEVLAEIADQIAGSDGEVWTVAPAFEQSGVSHAISWVHPTLISQIGPRSFAAEGSPADCVLAGLHDVLTGAHPDLVLSGVNRGNNAGENAVYSGTVGGAMEAALHGIPAIALSQFWGPGNASLDDPFEAARAHGAATVRRILDAALWADDGEYALFYNVNFPPCPADRVQGLRVGRQGLRRNDGFSVEAGVSPNGRRFLWARGRDQSVETGPGTDVSDNLAGHVSVVPMRCDLTAHAAVATLRDRLG